MLTEEQKAQIKAFVERIEVDVDDLDSYEYDSNPYGLEYPLCCGSGSGDWDEDEEYEAKKERAVALIELDGVGGYFSFGIEEDKDPEEYFDEVIEFIRGL